MVPSATLTSFLPPCVAVEVVEGLSCRREVSVCRDLSVDELGRLRKMEGEKERLV